MTGALVASTTFAVQAEAKSKVSLDAPVEVSTDQPNVDAKTILAPDAAKSALEGKLDLIAACGDVEGKDALKYKATLSVDGTGAVVSVTVVENTLPAPIATCVEGVLKEVKTSALSAPVKVTVALALSQDESAAAAAVVGPAQTAPVAGGVQGAAGGAAAAPGVEAPAVVPSDPANVQAGGAEPQPAAPAAPEAAAVSGPTGVEATANPDEPTKPWRVTAVLNQSLGAGTFVKDEFAKAPYYAYALSLRGSYSINDLLTAGLRMDMDQELTLNNQAAESGEAREFFFREVRLSLATKKLFKDVDYTGIEIDLGTSLRLPTDKASQAAGRLFGWTLAATVKRTFEKLGPGDLSLTWSPGYRENFGPRAPDLSDQASTRFAAGTCRVVEGDGCTGPANTARTITNALTVEYAFLENFTATVDFTVVNYFLWDLSTSPGANGVPLSRFSTAGGGRNDLAFGTIELAYNINENFSVAGGVLTQSDPFLINPDGSRSLRFPFFDFNSTATNRSVFYVDFGFTY